MTRPSSAPAILVGVSLFMEMLDGSILSTALPTMAREFGVAPVSLQIAVTAYLTAMAICIPASGWMARRIGARRLFCLGVTAFTLASAACAVSPGVEAFVAGRTLQGAAAAMMMPVGRLVILRNLPKERLIGTIAILTWPALLAPAIAPPLAGFVVEYTSWRWLFAINVPLGLIGVPLAARILPYLTSERAAPFDLRGLMLWAVAATILVCVVGDAARLGMTVTLAALGIVAATLWALWRHIGKVRHPLLEPDLLIDRSLGHSLRGGSLVRMAIFANPFLQPLLLQVGFGMRAVDAGVLMLIGMAGNIGVKPLTTPIILRWSYRTILVANGIVLTIGMVLFTALRADTPRIWIAALLVATGAARSLHFTALNTLSFRSIGPERMTAANTLFSTVMQMNAALGVAIGALALQAWPALSGSADASTTLGSFRFAFLVLAGLTLAGSLSAMGLGHDRSEHADQPPRTPAVQA